MQQLNRQTAKVNQYPTKVIQFGEGNFLRAFVDWIIWNTNQKTGIIVAEARGVILLAATLAKIPIYEYTPLQIKQAVVGYGRAEKNQVIAMVTTFLHLQKPPKPDDTADALAAAICHAHSGTSALAALYNRPTTMRGKIDG